MVTGAVTEDQRVTEWRREELTRAGFNDVQAALLGERHDIDLHLAIQMVDLGCPPEIAISILT